MADAELLREAVREAGALARSLFQQSVKRWTKSDGSPVTEADFAVDNLLKDRLAAARKDYGWLSEETPSLAWQLTGARCSFLRRRMSASPTATRRR